MNAKTPTPFKVGDRVTWTHCSAYGQRMGFTTHQGTVLSIAGQIATVKLRNGRTDWQYLTALRQDGQTTELTEAFKPTTKEGK